MPKKNKDSYVICIDFDGTCTTHSYPNIGKDIGAVPVLKALVNKGHKLILWTMRCDGQKNIILDDGYEIYGGDFLTQAVNWFKDNEIPLYGIQRNPTQDLWTTSNKCYGDYYIDDAAIGTPLINDSNISDRPFVDWKGVEALLTTKGIL